MTLEYDPLSAEFQANPYPTYRRLRVEDPVHHRMFDGEHLWLLTRYEDCVSVLRDPRCSAQKFPAKVLEEIAADPESPLGQLARISLGMMLVKDPPDHTRLRTLVNKAFTPRQVESLRPRLQRVVEELLDAVRDRGGMDVIADLAAPLPLIAIAELLGLPPADRARLKLWSDRFVTFIDGTIRDAGIEQAALAVAELRSYLGGIIEERRRNPRQDLISGLVTAHEAGDRLSEDELYSTVTLLLAAGHETTTNLIGNGLLALLRHPDQLQKLRAEPELIRPAIEELLRYDSPVQVTSRIPRADIEICGTTIPAGQEINTSFGAANRDPKVFPEPDRLDISRSDNRHLSFGLGVHFCLGAALARLEGCIAIQTVVQRMRRLELDTDKLEWRPGIVLRGLRALPVRF
ncbi:MAG: cytochrome P450 [Myxococcales bacterium]|nr:cytochrome P450 [Myxococcales bacterium]